MIKVAITGSQLYENKRKIKDAIFKLKETFKDDLEIVSGGRKQGADKYVKKYALEFGCEYREYNPAHTNKNLYSVLPETFYGKQYSVKNIFIRNSMLVKAADYLILFMSEKDNGADILHVIDTATKINKKIVKIF